MSESLYPNVMHSSVIMRPDGDVEVIRWDGYLPALTYLRGFYRDFVYDMCEVTGDEKEIEATYAEYGRPSDITVEKISEFWAQGEDHAYWVAIYPTDECLEAVWNRWQQNKEIPQ